MSGQQERRPGELVFAIIIAVFSGAALWQAYKISGFTGLSKPGVFPMAATCAMLISAIFIFRDTVQARSVETVEGLSASGRFLREVMPKRLIVMMAIVAIYIVTMPLLGFVVASGLFLFVSFAYLWRKSLLISLLLAAFSLIVVYSVFRIAFQVVLPQGNIIPAGIF